jgi:formylglycine-generating enzyme required for sulfatase activity
VGFGDPQRLELSLDCAGQPSDPQIGYTCSGGARVAIGGAAAADDGAPTRMGTWMNGYARNCAGAARDSTGVNDDEACVAGGAFWMGDLRRQGLGPAFDAVPEHPVALSPFFLDRYEFTVGRFRKLLKAGFQSAGLYFERVATDAYQHRCNLYLDAADDPARDALPLNCVSQETGIDACAAEGRRLPSEAEWEWAAGSREHEWLYPWGDDAPACGDLPGCDPKSAERKYGAPVGSHPRDQSADGVFDLSSNLIEWLNDDFVSYGEGCWAPGAYGPDPTCVAAHYVATSVRSGAYDDGAAYRFMVTNRRSAQINAWGPTLGFRCARTDDAP